MIKRSLLLVPLMSFASIMFSSEVSDLSKLSIGDEQSKENAEQGDLVRLVDLVFKKDVFIEVLKNYIEGLPAEIKSTIIDKVSNKLSIQPFKEKLVKIYIENYTQEEIADLLKFYDSKSGKKILEKLHIVSGEVSKTILEAVKELVAETTNTVKMAAMPLPGDKDEEKEEFSTEC